MRHGKSYMNPSTMSEKGKESSSRIFVGLVCCERRYALVDGLKIGGFFFGRNEMDSGNYVGNARY